MSVDSSGFGCAQKSCPLGVAGDVFILGELRAGTSAPASDKEPRRRRGPRRGSAGQVASQGGGSETGRTSRGPLPGDRLGAHAAPGGLWLARRQRLSHPESSLGSSDVVRAAVSAPVRRGGWGVAGSLRKDPSDLVTSL